MPLTNAEYLADPQASPSPERAQRLARFVRTRDVGRALIKPALLLGLVCALWVVWALWLAFNASPQTPSQQMLLWPSVGALIVGMVIAISRAVGLTTGPFWEAQDSIPRELLAVPRRAIVPRMPLGGVFAGIAFACAVAIGGLTVSDVRNAAMLQQDGVETTGTVVSRTIHNAKSRRYLVTYRYSAQNMVLQNTASVPRSNYESMSEGSTIRVTYSATNPMVSKPFARAGLRSATAIITPLIAIVGGLLSLGALMTLLMTYAQKQTERIATNGVAVLARMNKVDHYAARYNYTTPIGVIDAKTSFGKQRPAPLPVEGETYVVLFDPDNPRRSMPLAMLQDVRFV